MPMDQAGSSLVNGCNRIGRLDMKCFSGDDSPACDCSFKDDNVCTDGIMKESPETVAVERVYSDDEEKIILKRLEALGYL